jgi:hypothetical protein
MTGAEEFAGLTRSKCADGCNEKGCAISGKGYCAHPLKGALQHNDMHDPAALGRMAAARAVLDRDNIEARITRRVG